MNPFKYGTIVYGNDFCGRKELIRQLSDFIKSGQNVVVHGERRVGKSSLIQETILRLKGSRPIFVDLMEVKSADDLCKRMLRSFIVSESKAGFLEKALKQLSRLRPIVSVDSITGELSLSLDASREFSAESINEVITLIEKEAKSKKIVVVLDEFQDILNLDNWKEVAAILRSNIQRQKNTPYVFSGSIRRKMDSLFTDHTSPFFKSAIPLTVEPLSYDEFAPFLMKKFAAGKRNIDEKTLKYIFGICDNVTGDIQQFCEAIWNTTSYNSKINEKNIPGAMNLIFAREYKSYEITLAEITDFQLKSLSAIARFKGISTFSTTFLKKGGFVNASSLRKALTRLVDLKILFTHKGEYRFANPFFRDWIISKGL